MPNKIDLLTASQVIKSKPKRPLLIIELLKRKGVAASSVKRIGG